MTNLTTAGLEPLDEATCFRYLAAGKVGRLGFTARAMPMVLPVNYRLVGSDLIFGTDEGSKLDAARSGDVACLEVDDWEAVSHEGWSVVATGRLSVVESDDQEGLAHQLRVAPWAGVKDLHLVRLPVEVLTGRRLRLPSRSRVDLRG